MLIPGAQFFLIQFPNLSDDTNSARKMGCTGTEHMVIHSWFQIILMIMNHRPTDLVLQHNTIETQEGKNDENEPKIYPEPALDRLSLVGHRLWCNRSAHATQHGTSTARRPCC